ncbi:hypothetical protein GJAV_G00127310 [Gymnothorax javanicus]|nr:hypothetical protein GJAV_G00127310 [Gymnothorax javanicus]
MKVALKVAFSFKRAMGRCNIKYPDCSESCRCCSWANLCWRDFTIVQSTSSFSRPSFSLLRSSLSVSTTGCAEAETLTHCRQSATQ